MLRTLAAVALVVAAALGAVGLTFSATRELPADFRFANGTEPKTLDPQLLTGEPGGRIVASLFEGLTRFDSRALAPAPGVAESWTISPDGRTYTFQLRSDARWSDGRPVTASDFTYAWRRLQDPALGAEYAYIMHGVRFAEALNTFGVLADRIEGPIVAALAELRSAHAGGVDAPVWQRFLSATGVRDALKGSPDPWLPGVFARETGRVEPDALERFGAALLREAARLREAHAEADRRFGVDAGVFARGERALVVELVAPTPYFLELTAFYPAAPAPRWVIEAPGNAQDWFLPGKIVSNGPFVLESWRMGERTRLVRSPHYWGRDTVALERVDALPIENATTALNLYLTGAVDWLPRSYPNDLVEPLRARDDFYVSAGLAVYYYRINCRKPPLDDPRVRRAINLAIDRELIANEVLGLGQLPARHLVPPGIAGYASPPSQIGLRVEEARQLLAEAGYPGGEGFPEIGILYNTNDAHKKIAEVIADQLGRSLGVPATSYNQEWQSYLATIRDGDYDMARAGWIGDYEDPNTFLDLWITGGGNNQTGWSHADYDRLLRAAANVEAFVARPRLESFALSEPERLGAGVEAVRASADPAARRLAGAKLRMELLREAEAILVQAEFPIIPLYFYVNSGLIRPEIGGFTTERVRADGSRVVNLQDRHPLQDLHRSAGRRP